MMKLNRIIIAAALLLAFLASTVIAKEAPKEEKNNRVIAKTNLQGNYGILNINNLWTWMRSNGESNHSPEGDNGVYYPRAACWEIYKDGFKWGGMCYRDAAHTQPAPYGQTIRMGGNDYGNGTSAGWIEGYDNTAVQVDPGDPRARIFRIRRDYYTMTDAELRQDAAEYFEQWDNPSQVSADRMQEIWDQYDKDWKEWPVDLGAPYIERNGQPGYQAPPAFSENFNADSLISQGLDEPGVAGADPNSPADMVLWNVYNDLDKSKTLQLDGAYPLGLEIQRTAWGYKRTDALGNIYFKRFRIINKGGVDVAGDGTTIGTFYIDSMYVAQWSDPDLGEYSEDLLGCDTTLSLGYVYNGNAIDAEFNAVGLVVPAAGYDFLAGPLVPSPGDKAVFNFQYKEGYKNMPMTAFDWFSAGSPISDPPSDYNGGIQWYHLYQGYTPNVVKTPYPLPPGHPPTTLQYSGDPVLGTGLLDGLGETYSFPPGDRRLLECSGPFTMAPGDTQEVTIGFVVGKGADRFSSISVMKFNDEFVQNTYDALFQVPSAPAKPSVQLAELDGKVIIDWGSDLAQVKTIENTVNEPGTYKFEGYNIYQLPSASSTLSEATRIATFDLTSDPTTILTRGFDAKSGMILDIPVQFGTNSGIQRDFVFDRDYILDKNKIYDGQEYYIAVTAYSHAKQEGYIPTSLESSPQVYTVVPKKPFGMDYPTDYADVLTVDQTSGSSDGIIEPKVVNPAELTGHDYKVTFTDTSGGVVANRWTLTDMTANKALLTDQENISGEGYYATVDGFLLKVAGPPLQGKSWDWEGDRWFTGAGDGELVYGGGYLHPSFSGGSGTAPPDFKTVEVRFVAKTGFTDLNGNGTYDIGEPYQMPEEGTQKAFMYYTWDDEAYVGFFDVPFTAWDIQDPDNPRQLNVIVRDRDQNQQWDLHNNVEDAALPNGGDQRYNYIFIAGTDYDPTGALHAPPSQGGTGWMGDDATQPGLWVLWLSQRGSHEPYGADVVLTLVPNFVITTNDSYQFTALAPETNVTMQKESVDRITVYPNPYYAFNESETRPHERFVTFTSLPPNQKVTIRVFNLAGQLVRILEKGEEDGSEFMRWELQNHDRVPVASGLYIAHVEVTLPSGGTENHIVKFAVIQEQEILNVY